MRTRSGVGVRYERTTTSRLHRLLSNSITVILAE